MLVWEQREPSWSASSGPGAAVVNTGGRTGGKLRVTS